MHRERNKAVVDTGVLVSAFAFGGVPRQALKKAFKECNLYVSRELLTEYRDVPVALAAAGKIDHQQFKALIAGIAAFTAKTVIVYPKTMLSKLIRNVKQG